MRNKKSKVLVIALIISLVAIITVGSLAWFTAKDEVTNTLKMADDFDIDVYETDGEGNVIKDGDKTVGQTYTGIMPGQKIHKDPTVRNTGTHNEYVRVNVTLSNYDVWSAAVEPDKSTGKVDLATIFTGFDPNAWKRFGNPVFDEANKTVTYTFYLNLVLEPNQAAALFTGVTIPNGLTSEQAQTIDADGFTIKVEAEAIQTENMGTDVTGKSTVAEQAYAAFALLEKN